MNISSIVYEELFKRKPKAIGRRFRNDGKFYLGTSASSGDIISLNSLAGEIYLICDGNKTVREIFSNLTERFSEISKDVISYDLCKCLSDLESFGLITTVLKKA